ncbi:MAG TPA: hypothetical protein VLI93_02820 [Acetobacteraceae bacterium]|nr:hypothetical protein [Acetobacteraceae bacterium]
MPASGYSIFTDVTSYQAKLRHMLDVLVLRSGGFHARLNWVELPSLRLLRAEEQQPRLAYVSLPRRGIFITFPTTRDSLLIYNGTEVRFGDIVLHSRGEDFHQRTIAATHWGCISVSPVALTAFSKAIAGQRLSLPVTSRILRPLRADRMRLMREHARVGRIAEKTLHHIAHPEVARALEQDLVCALVNCLMTGEPPEDSSDRRREAGILSKLEAVLVSDSGRVLKVSEICNVIGVSHRTLTICCFHFLGMGPGRYLRLRRVKRKTLPLPECELPVLP